MKDVDIVIQWKLDTACEALKEALENLEAVERYLKMRDLEQHEITLKDLGWVRKVS